MAEAGQRFPQRQPQQQPHLFEESSYRRLRQALLEIGVHPELASQFTHDDLGLLLRHGFKDARGLLIAKVNILLQVGIRAFCASCIETAQRKSGCVSVSICYVGIRNAQHV